MKGIHRSISFTPLLAMLTMFLAPERRADAQDVAPGTRVRITYDAQRMGVHRIVRGANARAIGTLERRDSSGYVVASERRETIVPVARVRRVDVSQGRSRNVAGGALLGAGGAAAGLLTMHFILVAPLGGEVEGALYPGIVAGSALVGAVMGYAFPQERWKRVDGQNR